MGEGGMERNIIRKPWDRKEPQKPEYTSCVRHGEAAAGKAPGALIRSRVDGRSCGGACPFFTL